ncbi:MAG: glycosyltransferase family 39 protein [Ignavibacteria bacterium]|jgi:hypothetical protein
MILNSNKRQLILVIIISAVAGLIAQYISFSDEYIFAYRDSIYRLDASRRFIDAVNPGIFNQIGTVWLPLPNFIMFPLASINFLWKTGLAGSIVNFIAFIINAIAIFYTIKLLTENKIAQYAGLLLFILNPNILYFQTTPMSEQIYITFFSLSIYYLIKWNKTKITKDIFFAGVFTAMASCTRYDGWTLAVATAVIIFIISIYTKQGFIKNIFYYLFPTAIVIIWWLVHNYIYYSDALEFMRGQFSTYFQLKYYESAGRLLTKHNFSLSLKVYYFDLYLYSGWLTLALSLSGFLYYVYKNKLRVNSFLVYLSLIAIPTTLLFLYAGQVIIEIPQSEPQGYFNSRYGLYAIPGLVIFAGIFVGFIYERFNTKINYLIGVSLLLIGLQTYSYIYLYPSKVPAIAEARFAGYHETITYKLSKYLEENYDGGNLLYDFRVFAIPPWSGVYLKERVTYHTFDIGEKSLVNPVPYAKWVLFYLKSPDDKIFNAMNENKNFRDNYNRVFSEDGLELYKRK